MNFERASGILLHPSSLPGKYGIGDIGPEALRWVDFLAGSGCKIWQILPLGPTGYGDSPYQCFSAFAGNPYLVSPALLLEDDLLSAADLSDRPDFPPDHVDYGPVIQWKITLLDRAFAHFQESASTELKRELEVIRQICVVLARLKYNFSDDNAGKEPYFKIERFLPAEQLAPLEGTCCPLEYHAMLQAGRDIFRFYQAVAPTLAKEHGIPVLEDCAHAHGTSLKGLRPGAIAAPERACRTLIATFRRGDSCSPAYTVPMPPSPSVDWMR